MDEWRTRLDPSGWKVYTLYGPPTKASPTGGWFLDDDEIGMPFLERVHALGPRVVAAHKGLGGPIPDQSVAAASPRDIGRPRPRSPTSSSSCTTPATSAIPTGKKARTTRRTRPAASTG